MPRTGLSENLPDFDIFYLCGCFAAAGLLAENIYAAVAERLVSAGGYSPGYQLAVNGQAGKFAVV
jgi:hypothetical protein